MSNKECLANRVKMYWQEFPDEENEIRNVLPTGTYCQPGNIINSTHVHVEAKPWLQKPKAKKKENKMSTIPPTKQAITKSKISNTNLKPSETSKPNEKENVNKAGQNNRINDVISDQQNENIENLVAKKPCTLSELRKEDKQRVADLVREMAKFSEEKEMAVQELTHLKTNFSTKLKSLEVEKQKMINEQDTLKEKLLRYELIIKEIKEKQKMGDGSRNSVESILNNHVSLQELSTDFQCREKPVILKTTPDKFPGNLRETKKHNGTKKVSANQETPNDKKHSLGDEFKDMSEFADLFFKQQDKFHKQQEILQKQIEQLQQLQESLLEQQQRQLRDIQSDSKNSDVQTNSSVSEVRQNDLNACEKLIEESRKGKYSVKLQDYISKQPKYGNNVINSTEISKGNVFQKVGSPSQVLVSDTLMDDDSKLVSVHCLNATSSSSSKVDSAVQTIDIVSIPTDVVLTKSKYSTVRRKEEVCLQTDSMVTKDVPVATEKVNKYTKRKDMNQVGVQTEMNRLELCKGEISKLEETLKDISSKKSVSNANIDTGVKENPKVDKDKKFAVAINTCKEIPILDDNYNLDLDVPCVERKNYSITSALERGHFQPASILELIDGLEPPSASTSIDHHSFKKTSPVNRKVSRRTPLTPIKQQSSHRTVLSPSNKHVKSKVKNERNSKLQKVYGTLQIKPNERNVKQKSSEDVEEQKMLADVFFVR